jgi:hypothetical protein
MTKSILFAAAALFAVAAVPLAHAGEGTFQPTVTALGFDGGRVAGPQITTRYNGDPELRAQHGQQRQQLIAVRAAFTRPAGTRPRAFRLSWPYAQPQSCTFQVMSVT